MNRRATKSFEKLVALQHNRFLQVIASTYVNLGYNSCIDVIILEGKVKDI